MSTIQLDVNAVGGSREIPQAMDIFLHIADREVIRELLAFPEGEARDGYARTALRIGVLALKQAEGTLDRSTVREEGEKLLRALDQSLTTHQSVVHQAVSGILKEYFDPQSGRFNERVERLVKRDGELEQILRTQVAGEESELSRTLAASLGNDSPLLKALDPENSDGFPAAVQEMLKGSLHEQRERILEQFSLDNKEGALCRFIGELNEKHGDFTEAMQKSVNKVVGEFSLDDQDSALSRLVGRVEKAQKEISGEFSLDDEKSALARMRRELLDTLAAQQRVNATFQEEVKLALVEASSRKKESLRSTQHGHDFEDEVFRLIDVDCQRTGDIAEAVGNTTGSIRNSKVGDVVIEVGPDQVAAGARIVIEAKERHGYTVKKALAELDTAKKNRGAGLGLFVMSARTAPEEMEPIKRYGDDVLVVWNVEDPSSDAYLLAGLSLCRGLCARTAAENAGREIDFSAIEGAIQEIEKLSERLSTITRLAGTIQTNGKKILSEVGLMEDSIARHVQILNENVNAIVDSLES